MTNAEDIEKLEPSYIAGSINSTATAGNNVAASQKVKHRVTMWPTNSIPRYIAEKNQTGMSTEIPVNKC